MANRPNRSITTTTSKTLHFVQVADRRRGTNSNPVEELPARHYQHSRRISPAEAIVELLTGDRDWPLWELWDGNQGGWDLGSRKRRTEVARLIADSDDLRHGWTQFAWPKDSEFNHPAFINVLDNESARMISYCSCWAFACDAARRGMSR